MKKIYLLTMGLVALVFSSRSQDNCNGRHPTGVTSPWTGFCVVIGNDLPPNTEVKLYTAEGGSEVPNMSNPHTPAFSDANGHVEIVYDCTIFSVSFMLACSASGCCGGPVTQGGPLPVKLTSFTGRLQNDNEVALDWTSAIEFESSKYEVERSVDGKNYAKVGTLKAAGSTMSLSRYAFTDHLPSAGAYYYRLKQIDFDETSEYSKVVYVNSKKGSGVITKIFPNPFKGEVQLIGATSSDLTPSNVKVFSISGQRITYRFMGANSILIDPSAPNGVYILQVKEQRFKLVKNPSGTSY